jgi:very-short-patch-repair endonuclease
MPGEPATPDDAPPAGRLAADRRLLGKLLPYYQEALRAGSGGAPVESLPRHGRSFVLLQPDSLWWPGERQSQTLTISRSRLSEGMLEALAKNSGRSLILGYPCLLVSPRDTDSAPFLRPVATLRCRFRLTDTALELRVPAIRPTLNPDWLTEQKRHGGWDVGRLRSWLLLEDESNPAPEEEDIDTAAFVDFPVLAGRLDAAVARSIRTRLDPACIDASVPAAPETGIYNAVALINDGGSKFTRSAIADYDRLTGLNEGAAADTALAALFDQSPPSLGGIPVLHPFAMSESQLVAAKAGLTGPLTVVTGPPGTGKSQMIAAVMLSAAAGGRSALLAARQHRALDAVQERLQDLAGDRAVLVRASEEGGGAGFGFHQAIQALLTRPDAPDAPSRFRERYRAVAAADAERWRHLDGWRELARSSNAAAGARQALQDAEAELDRALGEASGKGIASPPERVERGLLRRLMAPLLRLFRPRPPAIGSAWRVREARCRVDRLRSDLAKAEREADALREKLAGTDDDPVALTERLTAETEDLVPLLLESLDSVDHATRQALTEIGGEAALQGRGSRVALTEDGARLILRHLPLWAVTTLAAGSRIPLQAGLFDYVIFDEAAQTDIASALPLLFRAKAAVVVGDPQQLAMISNLDPREECDLLRRFDLFHPGIGRFSQGRTSLFDLAAGSSAARRFLLTDHFRCHPQIAGYINEAFYGRRLAALTDVSRLRVPSGYRPGLHWTDVTGPIEARSGAGQSGSAASTAEAAAVADEVARLTGQRFEGSIGVVAFFDYQAKKIQDLLRTRLSPEDFNRHQIKVFTANKFQGDERDVMLFSLCLGPDMPSGARYFIQQEKRLLNVAVSRARAVCHIFGDLSHAADCGIPHVETLVRQVRRARDREAGPAGDRFESPWEARLYDALVAAGLAPMPQYPVGGRFLDLALIDDSRDPPIRLDIEVDGAFYHQDEFGDRIPTDLWRDHQLRALGWKVLRFWVRELRDEMERCVGRVLTEYRA